MKAIYVMQRLLLAAYGLITGTVALACFVAPHVVFRACFGRVAAPAMMMPFLLFAGTSLGLAFVALVAARIPRPPFVLVTCVAIGMFASVAAPYLAGTTATMPASEMESYRKLLYVFAALALSLGASLALRAFLSPRISNASQ